jgi:hypothetical protein
MAHQISRILHCDETEAYAVHATQATLYGHRLDRGLQSVRFNATVRHESGYVRQIYGGIAKRQMGRWSVSLPYFVAVMEDGTCFRWPLYLSPGEFQSVRRAVLIQIPEADRRGI